MGIFDEGIKIISQMPGWLNWFVLLLGLGVIFVFWSWIPLERLDRFWRWNNPVGRPLLNTLVLTGLPAVYAKATGTPGSWVLILLCFFLTQYAVLSGRFLKMEMLIAGWVMVVATAAIWVAFYTLCPFT